MRQGRQEPSEARELSDAIGRRGASQVCQETTSSVLAVAAVNVSTQSSLLLIVESWPASASSIVACRCLQPPEGAARRLRSTTL